MAEMSSRERVIAAVEFSGPDRVPFRHCALPAAFPAHPDLPKLLADYPSDFAGENGEAPKEMARAFSPGEFVDEWQCTWTMLLEGYLGQVTVHPLADLDRLPDYEFPSAPKPSAPKLSADGKARQKASGKPRQRYQFAGGGILFERMIHLCGFDNLLTELGLGSPRVLELRDRIVAYNLALVHEGIRQDVDAIGFADDWGTQTNLMISPALWREVFLPAYRRLFAPVREAGKHVYFHTDGHTLPILPDLVKAGVQIFWADLTVNPLSRLRAELGGKVCFQTLTDVQFILPHGTPEEAGQHGRDLLAALGSFDGGVIACTEVGPDQPWENVLAIFETFREEGEYPLKLGWSDATGAYRT